MKYLSYEIINFKNILGPDNLTGSYKMKRVFEHSWPPQRTKTCVGKPKGCLIQKCKRKFFFFLSPWKISNKPRPPFQSLGWQRCRQQGRRFLTRRNRPNPNPINLAAVRVPANQPAAPAIHPAVAIPAAPAVAQPSQPNSIGKHVCQSVIVSALSISVRMSVLL